MRRSTCRWPALPSASRCVAPQSVVPSTGALTPGDVVGSRELEELSPGGGFQAALRLLASVIEVPGGVAIKGGRPSQAAVQLGAGSFVDPATGLSQVRLPDDAIDSVTVLPNPYAVEFGRFSSGLVLIQTRRAGDKWRTRLNNLDPTFRTVRGSAFDITGIASFSPRIETGGPLIKDKLFIQQAAQYRYRTSDVPEPSGRSAAQITELQLVHPRRRQPVAQTLARRAGRLFPERHRVCQSRHLHATRRHRRIAWRRQHRRGDRTHRCGAIRCSRKPPSRSISTATDAESAGQPADDSCCRWTPTPIGNFFNQQSRSTTTVSSWSRRSRGRGVTANVLHLFKAGIDVLHARLNRTERELAGLDRATRTSTLVRRLDFGRADHAGNSRAPTWRCSRRTGAADHSLVRRVRRAPRPRRRDRSIEPDAAHRLGAAVQRVRHRGAARRFRPVLRAHALGGRRVHPVRERDRHALCADRSHGDRRNRCCFSTSSTRICGRPAV